MFPNREETNAELSYGVSELEDGGWRIETREILLCVHKAPMSGSKRGIPLITPLNILNPFRFTISRILVSSTFVLEVELEHV